MLWRALLAGIVVVACSAAAVTTAALLQVKSVTGYLDQSAPLRHSGVVLPAPGAPETLLLVGSDNRYGQGTTESNTDTMLLVRINADSSTINLLSIPRDLEVRLPGGVSKLNAAWETGGPKLLIDTLRTQVFPGTNFNVNHIINIDFAGFSDLINAIGCVYTMVDHRYYNDTAQTGYSSINIEPGYQKLCGGSGSNVGGASTALAFVRFRHTDSDLVRESRQQDFLRWARDQFSTSDLLDNRDKLLRIFGRHVSTDSLLHSTDGLLELFDLAVNANGHGLRSIKFPISSYPVIDGEDYLAAETSQTVAAYRTFITPTVAEHKPLKAPKKRHKPTRTGTYRLPAGMVSASNDGVAQAAALGKLFLPIYYPQDVPANSTYCFSITGNCLDYPNPTTEYGNSYPRAYEIRGDGTTRYPAYVLTLVINKGLGEYFNVEGTTWQYPPILHDPTSVQTIKGKKLYEYFNGGNLSLVAWHTPRGAYWIANTLQDDIPKDQMIAMALTLTKATRR
jgi:LCP family protein required for cell wall assembly